MDNQHQKIKGYRDLTQVEIDLMNEIKEHAARTEALISKVNGHVSSQHQATTPAYAPIPADASDDEKQFADNFGTEIIDTAEQTEAKLAEANRLKHAEPWRWQAIAKTKLQEGFMALTRAVAQPTTF